jgi:hypothetical protein
LSQQWTVSGGAVKSSTTETDPAGGSTAALITNLQNADNARINRNLAITEDSAFGVFLKGTAGETINIEHGTDQQTVTLTSDWKLYTLNVTAPQTTLRIINRSGCTADEVYVAFPHVYRSDLGGMVDNPDRGDSYVPTTSAAKYLPRVGHHVYNGSAWVNEGVLAESESRTNIITGNDDLDNATYWQKGGNLTATKDASVTAPDGNSAWKLTNGTVGNFYFTSTVGSIAPTNDNYITLSCYLKKGSARYALIGFGGGTYSACVFDFDTESVVVTGSNSMGVPTLTTTVQPVGNDWYRVGFTHLQDASSPSRGMSVFPWTSSTLPSGLDNHGVTGDSETLYVAFPQAEYYATPSSLIPTSGSSVSRAAETFTIPSANLPWPTPQYIGDELVTNGTFDTDSDWTKGTGWSISGDTASSDGSQTANSQLDSTSNITLEAGKLYLVSYDVVREAGTVSISVTTELAYQATTSSGTYSYEVLATGGTRTVKIRANSSFIGSVDNISVREINPLSVSIGMEGRVTYADTNSTSEVTFVGWPATGSQPYIRNFMRTNGSYKGALLFKQYDGSTADNTFESVPGSYSPDILVPFSIASRHGSTFINGATDGVALTANTTPTALPDLSSTDLNLAYDYMGTISEFRVWDKDLGDAGIVEATNPSLEPSLSLTFEGTGTNSFVVNNWAE